MQRNQPTIYIHSKSMKELKPKLLPYICSSPQGWNINFKIIKN
jgi:hypothetical protein